MARGQGLVNKRMNILFLTLLDIRSINSHDIYADLMRELAKRGHRVYIVSPTERRNGCQTELIESIEAASRKKVYILKIKTGNIQKTNLIEKGISTIILEYQFKIGIQKNFEQIAFDLILYSTPPITLLKPIKFIRNRDNAKTYLMLKDIFPQNAVDIGMLSMTGVKGFLYKWFRRKEKKLYEISDRIGCMSQANVDYIIRNNPEVDPNRVEICPNCIEIQNLNLNQQECILMRKKYGLPKNKVIFVYGGNLGKPQGITFIIECLKEEADNKEAFFLIVGDGTEYERLEAFVKDTKPANVKLMKRLRKEDYDKLIAACDVGMIFLDYRFTIPNFPSRLLDYMQAGVPILACTDVSTDIGKVIQNGGFGWWSRSNDVQEFSKAVSDALECSTFSFMKERELTFLYQNYQAKTVAEKVIASVRGTNEI